MAGAIQQAFDNVVAASGTSVAVSATLTSSAASAVVCAATNDATTASTITCGDPTNGATSYTLLDDILDTTDQQRMVTFAKTGSTAGGSVTVTANWSAAESFKALSVTDCTGVAGSVDKHTGQYQHAPTTGTDATSSGTTATLNQQPALVVGFGFNANATGGQPALGTGFSGPVTGVSNWWSFGGPTTLSVEYKRVTATTGVAATFTAAGNVDHITMVVVIDEVASAGLTAFAETTPPSSRPSRAPRPADPQPLRSIVAPTTFPAGDVSPPQQRVFKEAQPDNPQVQPAMTQPFARNVDMNPPVRRPDRRTAIEPYPQPLPAIALPALTALETSQSTRSQVPSRRQLHDPQVLPNLIIPPPAITNDWAPGRRTRAPRPADPPPLPAIATNPYAFPWIPHASGRYFVNANGQPVFINGLTVWAAMTMDATEQAQLIANCVANRVNVIECGLIWRASTASDPRWSTRAPFGNNGALLPFLSRLGGAGSWGGSTTDPDYTTTNSAYFAFAKAFVDACAAAGILVLLFPSYTGTSGGGGSTPDDGWANEMVANQVANTSNMQTYGVSVATTFAPCPNICWGMGGDAGTSSRPFTGSERDAVIGMVNGILSVGGQASQLQFGAEWGTGSIVDDQTDFLNGVSGPTLGSTGTWRTHYEFFGSIITLAARGFSTSPTKPCIVQELPFYREDAISGTGANPAATDPVRRWYAWAWTSGCIAGVNVGNGYVWPSNISANLPFRDDWRLHTSDQNAAEMSNMRTLAETLRWWLAQPSPSIITANAGTGDGSNTSGPGGGNTTKVTALTSTDGSFIVIYYPPDQTGAITVDTTSLNSSYRARYYDVTNNTYTTIGTSGFTHTPNSATVFSAPPTNSLSQADQFIVLDTQTAAIVTVEPADSRKQAPRSPHLHQSAHALPAPQNPALISAALVIDAVAREPRPIRPPSNVDPLPALILPWIDSNVGPPQARGAGAIRSAPVLDPTYPLLILPWIDLPPGPIQVRSPRSELRAANVLTLPPPPFTPGGVDLPWAPGRTMRPPPPAYGDVPPPIVSPWSPEAALVAWRPTRAPMPSWGEATAALVFSWTPEPAAVAWRPTRAPQPPFADSLEALVFPWTPEAAVVAWRPTKAPAPVSGDVSAALVFSWAPEPAPVAQQRARRGDLRQLAGEPLPPVVVATFTAWGFEPPPSWPRTRYLQRDRAVAGGEPLPAVVLATFPPWGFEPAQPGARRFRLDRSASGEPLPQLILPWADTYAPPAARAQRPDRGAGATGPQPVLSLPPIAEQVMAVARAQQARVGWASDALGAPILPSLGGWDTSPAIARPAARPLVVSPDAAPPLVIAVHGFVYADTSAQRRREKVWTTIERPTVIIPPAVFPWGYEATPPIVRYGLRTGLPYLALVLPAALPPPVPPTFPLPPPFAVQLVDEGGPVDLRGKTVLCRTRPADHSRVTIVDAATVVDAIRGLVQKTWTERDLRGVPTGDMLLQFVVTDGQGRPRTYPGGGRYYHQEITGRTR